MPEMGLFLSVETGERWGENEGPGKVRKLDRISDVFSAIYDGGEGGIRTHVPFRTRRFRGAPVTTTSVPLRLDFADDLQETGQIA